MVESFKSRFHALLTPVLSGALITGLPLAYGMGTAQAATTGAVTSLSARVKAIEDRGDADHDLLVRIDARLATLAPDLTSLRVEFLQFLKEQHKETPR